MTGSGGEPFSDEQLRLIDRLSGEAIQQPASAREAFIREGCQGDDRICREVLSLVEQADESGQFPLTGAAALPGDVTITESTPTDTSVPRQIGRYKILDLLGEGGFGRVYRAEQQEPVRREVALKIIKLGMDTRQVVARFESERQALALMDHPNVARVFDGGATENGRPYFVMELVQGVPVTRYCDEGRLGLRERLALFISICRAIQHAHQKSIIHRDIKPANVLVARQDDRPVVKVIDFGIAKATSQPLTEQTLFTHQGQLLGTPSYMSPEQAEGSLIDIDTRTDVYSLGVLLYELLTGVAPFDPGRLRDASYNEIQRIIREEDPPRPSTRLSTIGDRVSEIARHRKLEPQNLTRLFKGDLDWIIMKALEKDRTRRYETANGFAADIERFLNDEPVLASPPSTTYRLRKLIRRNRAAFMGIVAVVIVLLIGAAGTTANMLWAFQERDRANAAAEKADAAAALAERKARTAERTSQFLVGLFEASDPEQARGKEISARELLDIGVAKIEEIDDEPEIKVELQETIGSVLMQLGKINEARTLLKPALAYREANADGDSTTLVRALHRYANLLDLAGDYEEAESIAKRAVEMSRRLNPESKLLAQNLNTLGNVIWHRSRLDEAAILFRESLAIRDKILPPEHTDIAQSLHNLGALRYFAGDLAEAESMYKRAIVLEEKAGGPDDPHLATSMHVLAIIYQDQGKYTEALELEERSLAIKEKVQGPEHPYVALSQTTLGNIYRLLDRPEVAEPYYRKAISVAEAAWGKEYGEVWWMRRCLASCLVDLDRVDEAERELDDLLRLAETIGEEPRLPPNLVARAEVHVHLSQWDEAERLYARAVGISAENIQKKDPFVMVYVAGYAHVLHRVGRLEEAAALFEEAIPVLQGVAGAKDLDLLAAQCHHAALLVDLGDDDRARLVAESALASHRARANREKATAQDKHRAAMAMLDCAIEALRDVEDALKNARQACKLTEDKNPVHVSTHARALFAMGKITEARDRQMRAIELLPEDAPRRHRFQQQLESFEPVD